MNLIRRSLGDVLCDTAPRFTNGDGGPAPLTKARALALSVSLLTRARETAADFSATRVLCVVRVTVIVRGCVSQWRVTVLTIVLCGVTVAHVRGLQVLSFLTMSLNIEFNKAVVLSGTLGAPEPS